LVDEFVQAVRRRFPRALLQWEDFKKGNAFRLLERYRKVLPSFNDDIQGTAAVAVAGVMAAARKTGTPLLQQRIVILGAGAAGVGIARLLRTALSRAEVKGDALTAAIAVLDSKGFVVDDTEIRDTYKKEVAWPAALAEAKGLGQGKPRDLKAVIRALKPTILIGTSGEPGTFSEDIVREMASHVERPAIFPMSNPTSQSEAVPSDLLAWTDGKALVATGSPFPPVEHKGGVFPIGQGNNAFIFPGVGLGALVAEAREVTDQMFEAGAQQLALELSDSSLERGRLFPEMSQLRRVTRKVAEAVVKVAVSQGVGREIAADHIDEELRRYIWDPEYLQYEPGPEQY
jgi:malic enzyme